MGAFQEQVLAGSENATISSEADSNFSLLSIHLIFEELSEEETEEEAKFRLFLLMVTNLLEVEFDKQEELEYSTYEGRPEGQSLFDGPRYIEFRQIKIPFLV